MDPRDIFEAATRLSGAARDAYLGETCGDDADLRRRVESLFQSADLPADPGRTIPLDPSATVSAEYAGLTIDRFRLVEQLGEGGFGTVWLAEQQEPVKRQVALKIIKLGMDTRQVIARFEAEKQALALMDHANIAKVFDAGATETGRPYFVMELVRGVPITEYCDTHELDIPQRLEIFMSVCQAIQHAHLKGVIHRDIKPSNVLVARQDGRPVPKVIDFGIAKATSAELTARTIFTEQGHIIGTPTYVSPEQAAMTGMDIDTRSDIYSLGVLLYELLTGTPPFDAQDLFKRGFAEMMRIIREEEPRKPSTRISDLGATVSRTATSRRTKIHKLSLILRGDLDWIVMKCLEKSRDRRYETAAGLVDDISRHLRSEPVTAGRPGARYRMGKFIRRNRGQVVAAAAVVSMLVLGVLGTSLGLVQALREQERAEAAEVESAQRADELEQVATFQSSQLENIDTAVMGDRLRESIISKHGRALAERGLSEDETTVSAAQLTSALDEVNFTSVALEALDENILQRALATIETEFEDQPTIKARLLQTLAKTMSALGLLEQAMVPQTEALEIRRRILGDEHYDTFDSIDNLGGLFYYQGHYDQAETCWRESLAGRRRVLGAEDPSTLTSMINMGVLLELQGEYREAESIYREALETSRRVMGDGDPGTQTLLNNLAMLLESQGKLEESEHYYREALAGCRSAFGDEHPRTLGTIGNLGLLLASQGKLEEGESLVREALAGCRRALGDNHPQTLQALGNLGGILFQQGRLDEAGRCWHESLKGHRSTLGDDHPGTLAMLGYLGMLSEKQGRFAEAEAYYREALAGETRAYGRDNPRTLATICELGSVVCSLGRLEEADQLGAEALAGRRRVLPEGHPDLSYSLIQHARTQAALWRFPEAEELALEGHAILEAALGPAHERTAKAVEQLVEIYDAWHGAESSAGHDRQSAAWREQIEAQRSGPEHGK